MTRNTQPASLGPPPELKILIIDDDPTIRETLSEMILVLNYRTVGAESGEEGLSLYQSALADQDPFDLVITDMTFPDACNGVQILAEVRRANPEAKVIVSTGFSSQYDLADYEKSGFDGFLLKPFGLKALQQCIQEALES